MCETLPWNVSWISGFKVTPVDTHPPRSQNNRRTLNSRLTSYLQHGSSGGPKNPNAFWLVLNWDYMLSCSISSLSPAVKLRTANLGLSPHTVWAPQKASSAMWKFTLGKPKSLARSNKGEKVCSTIGFTCTLKTSHQQGSHLKAPYCTHSQIFILNTGPHWSSLATSVIQKKQQLYSSSANSIFSRC